MENEPADEMAALYRSFSSALTEGGDLAEFSKDDLLDIYDYSRSVPDDYIANEAIAVGLRRFPGCKDLIKRKGLFFHDLGQDSLCELILSGLPEGAFTRRMAQLKNDYVTLGSVPKLDDEMRRYHKGSVEDGDLMYMVDLFDSIDRLDLVESNAEAISEISQYPSTIFSELYSLAFENGEYKKACMFGQRLTEVEPFNVGGWTELANLYLTRIGDMDAALDCAEYALAVSPDDIGAKMIKALIIYDKDKSLTHGMIDQALVESPDDPRALYVAACVDFYEKNFTGGIEKILRSLPGFNIAQRREAIDLLLRSIVKALDRDVRGSIEEVLLSDPDVRYEYWINELVERKAYVGAYELASIAMNNRRYEPKSLEEVSAVLEAMYFLELYEEMVCFVTQGLTAEEIDRMPAFYALVYATSLFKAGRVDQLRHWLERYMDLMRSGRQVTDNALLDNRLLKETCVCRLELMQRFLSGDTEIAESSFNPFVKR